MMFQIAEWLSTFIENLVVLSAVTQIPSIMERRIWCTYGDLVSL